MFIAGDVQPSQINQCLCLMRGTELAMKIDDVLTHKGNDVKTISPDAQLGLIIKLLATLDIASVVVISANKRPLGIVTERQLIRMIARRGEDSLDLTAAEVMETPVPVCSPNDSVSYAMRQMTERRTRHLIVKKAGIMRGIVSIGDLVECHIRNTELENRVLRDVARARIAAA